jgi:hypothetical protein
MYSIEIEWGMPVADVSRDPLRVMSLESKCGMNSRVKQLEQDRISSRC